MQRFIVTLVAVPLLLTLGACGNASQTDQPGATSARGATDTAGPAIAASSAAEGSVSPLSSSVVSGTEATAPTESAAPSPATGISSTSMPTAASTPAHVNVLDVHSLPLGDGKVSTSPKADYVFSCQTQFKLGGAQHVGSWIHGDTWDLTEKTAVEGAIVWPDAQFRITTSESERTVTGNGLPVDSATGIFPIQQADPAYQIDTNPNSILKQDVSFSLPLNPTFASTPSCVPMGMIGVALNGVAIFNALDASGRDAVAHETQDVCDGHPQSDGIYHYHGPSPCMPGENENNQLVGYALDGFGIYSMYDARGKELTDADLDACHGTTSEVIWNGKMVNMYHYVLTQEYPYTIGCFMGTPIRARAAISPSQPAAAKPDDSDTPSIADVETLRPSLPA